MKFEDVKKEIYEKIYRSPNNLPRSYKIIEGFINLTVTPETPQVAFGGTMLPVVAVVQQETGHTLFFNPYALLEEI